LPLGFKEARSLLLLDVRVETSSPFERCATDVSTEVGSAGGH
jgi:hypothetical protein